MTVNSLCTGGRWGLYTG